MELRGKQTGSGGAGDVNWGEESSQGYAPSPPIGHVRGGRRRLAGRKKGKDDRCKPAYARLLRAARYWHSVCCYQPGTERVYCAASAALRIAYGATKARY
eukprot:2373201-Rhodomonas_salina.2